MGAALLSAILARAKAPQFFVRWMRHPRYRVHPKAPIVTVSLASGLYTIGKRSQAVQYVRDDEALQFVGAQTPVMSRVLGMRRRGRLVRESEFRLVSLWTHNLVDPTVISHVDSNHHGAIVEELARGSWRRGEETKSCELLRYGVMRDLHDLADHKRSEPNWRIYYLLAKNSLRASDPSLAWMVNAIKQVGEQNTFEAAIRSWTVPDSRWRKRLAHIK